MSDPTAASASRWRAPVPAVEAALVGAVVLAVYLLTSVASALLVGAINDDGVYAALGRAIADGQGYRSLHLVGAPVQVKYPPGFPLLLSLLWRMGGTVESVQHLVAVLNPCAVGIAAGLLWWIGLVRFGASRPLLAVLVVLPLLLDSSVQYYSIILSEPWLLLGWAGAATAWYAAWGATAGPRRLGLLTATGLLIAATTLTRTQGIALLPALVTALLLHRFTLTERLSAVAAALVPLVLWRAYHATLMARGPVSTLPDEGTYLQWMQGSAGHAAMALLEVARVNLHSYLSQFAPYLSGISALGWALSLLLLGGAVVGAALALRREPLLAVSSLAAVLMVLLWPFAQDRLLLPVLPFLGLAAAGVIAPRVAGWAPLTRRRLGAALLVLFGAVVLRQPAVRGEAIAAFSEGRQPTFFSPAHFLLVNSRYIAHASRWIRDNTRPTDRIMIDNHSGIYLYSGRATLPANPTESRLQRSVFEVPGQYLASHILRDSLDYVIIGIRLPGIMRDLETVAGKCPGVLTWGGTGPNDSKYIFRVKRDEACLARIAGGE